MAQRAEWYVARLKPGANRVAKPRIGEAPERKGEFLIERSLRDAGFDIFMPSMRREVRHHRTKALIEKRHPLLVGYVFVNLGAGGDFYTLSRCDGVGAILGYAGRPMPLKSELIESMIQAESDADAEFERKRRERIARAQKPTKRALEEMHPKGTKITIAPTHRLVGGMIAEVLGATGRNSLRVVINALGGMVPVEIDLADVDKVA